MNFIKKTILNTDQTVLKAEDIIAYRSRKRGSRIFVYAFLSVIVLWSVKVTIIEDTDWERMGSIGKVISSAARFFGVDFNLFPDLLIPSLETLMISFLGTFLGVLICIPCLLYTSPSPRDGLLSRMPSSA